MNTVLPLFTTIFSPNIISPGLDLTILRTFWSDWPYRLVLPVTIASASPHDTIQEPHTTLSFLTSLSQSLSRKPFSLWSFSNIYSLYFSLFSLFVEFIIWILKFSLYPISFNLCLTTFSFATKIGIPKPLFWKAIAALSVFSSSPSAKTTLFWFFFIWELIPCIIVTDGSNLCLSWSE